MKSDRFATALKVAGVILTLLAVSRLQATSDTPTETIGRATKIRFDAATLTPDASSWNPDGTGTYGTYWFASGTAGYTATYSFGTNDNEYDLMLQIKTGPALSKALPFIIHFQPGGSYQLGPDPRIVSTDTTSAASGIITRVVDTSGPTFPDADFVYLGRYKFPASGTGSVVCDVADAPGGADAHIPISLWVAETAPRYGTIDNSFPVLSYNDYNSVPAGWFWPDTTEFDHYWENATNDTGVFRAVEYIPLPADDRVSSGTGVYRIDFTDFVIWHEQDAVCPIDIYFEPGGSYTLPSLSGDITAVDSTNAASGHVSVTVNWPRNYVASAPWPPNTFSLGEYQLDAGKMYGVRLNDYPTGATGQAFGPEVVSLTFLRPVVLTSVPPQKWRLYR